MSSGVLKTRYDCDCDFDCLLVKLMNAVELESAAAYVLAVLRAAKQKIESGSLRLQILIEITAHRCYRNQWFQHGRFAKLCARCVMQTHHGHYKHWAWNQTTVLFCFCRHEKNKQTWNPPMAIKVDTLFCMPVQMSGQVNDWEKKRRYRIIQCAFDLTILKCLQMETCQSNCVQPNCPTSKTYTIRI